jgi:CubicO group peptidase (beta-lactamase class C family)
MAQRPPQRQVVGALEQRIPALMDTAGVIGLVVAVIRDGRVVWAQGFGSRHADSAAAVGPHTVFEAASLSKPVFAYAVVELANAGVLSLDSSLSAYVTYDYLAHDPRYTAVTARHVLSHQAGLPNWRPRGGILEFQQDPGAEFGYSGEGYMYLQRAVESVMQESAGVVTRALVFEHFNMQRSGFEPTPAVIREYATGHDHAQSPIDKTWPDRTYVAYGLHTTVLDFCRFMIGLREEWLQESPGALATVRRQVNVDSAGLGWGLGWGLESTPGGPAVWHWGDNPGFKHFAYLEMVTGNGVVAFTNTDAGMAVMPELAMLALGIEPRGLGWLDYPRYDEEGGSLETP